MLVAELADLKEYSSHIWAYFYISPTNPNPLKG
jgi:hypothetical protein